MYCNVHSNTIYNSQVTETMRMSSNRSKDKEDTMEYCSDKNSELRPLAAPWMNSEVITLSEVRKRKTDTM